MKRNEQSGDAVRSCVEALRLWPDCDGFSLFWDLNLIEVRHLERGDRSRRLNLDVGRSTVMREVKWIWGMLWSWGFCICFLSLRKIEKTGRLVSGRWVSKPSLTVGFPVIALTSMGLFILYLLFTTYSLQGMIGHSNRRVCYMTRRGNLRWHCIQTI